jgi:hypothetical protein
MKCLMFTCLFLSLCWRGRDGVRSGEVAVEKSQSQRGPVYGEAKP